ncbi:TlpA family protein disulfide reductase [Pontibacter qinzhouensis]|uniref:TlpA family protein disulfide reductase n=1 Tax=Pontibacter qinzhouensis TaxID=2603253 RepID=A0A5C8IYR8_9BACT|nr:TlpA disulfide reductase family protein [Pontibacter qinzhouensis]TXK27229.1 TlpA family protein disulfide reductase [Pontibacter qinzhouensis]
MSKLRTSILMLMAFLLVGPSNANPLQATVINRSTEKKVFLYYKNVFLEQNNYTLSPNDTLNVAFDDDAFSPVLVSTPVGNKHGAGIFLMPGDTVYISYNEAEDNYDYTGSHPVELALAKKLGQARFSLVGPYDQVAYGSKMKFEYFLEECRKVRSESEDYINELNSTHGVRPTFKAHLEREIQLRVFSILLLPAILQNPKEVVRPYPQFYQDTVRTYTQILQEQESLSENASERLLYAMSGYAMFIAALEGRYGDFKVQYEIAKREYTGYQREWVCFTALKAAQKSNTGVNALIRDYQTWAQSESKFVRKLMMAKELNEVAFLHEAELNDPFITLNNEQTSLFEIISKNRGKVIFLDLWASWCMPCLIQFPASLQMREQYGEEDLAVIYLSVDTDHEKWLEASAKHLWNVSCPEKS